MSKPATLEDVADRSGVSTATISRCLNSPTRVAPATRARVEAAIDELGYVPNYGGRALASNRSNTVGAVIPTMANAMFASGLQSFQETLTAAGKTLLVGSAGYSDAEESRQIRSLVAHGVDGLLLIGAARAPAALQLLADRQIPVVLGWYFRDDPAELYAGFDNARAAAGMADTVLQHGHTKIAMITGESAGNDRARARIAGVRETLSAAANPATLVDVQQVESSLEGGATGLAALMQRKPAPTAIICANDVLAAGALLRARELGIDVPGQLSITGFDDIELARAVTPALTTVRVPQMAMGVAAAELLLAQLDEGMPTQQLASVEFDTEIILRDSLGPAITP